MSETKISAAIRKMIRAEFPQIIFDRMHCGCVKVRGGYMKLAEPGWPDYVGFLPDGRFIGIEVKDPDGTTNKKRFELQKAKRDAINLTGAVAFQTDSVDDCRQKLLSATCEK